ncbi:MAG: hypothetical protein JNM10_02880 [Planctomycetia bacterium]|nr:hypothetical protein [Planctomycetia bacterium]
MNLHVHVARPAAAAHAALLEACRARGLVVAGSHATPRGPSGRGGFVVELADPLPDIPADGAPSAATRNVYPISVFDTDPGHCRVATLLPAPFVDLLGHPEAAAAAASFEVTLRAVLDDVVRGVERPGPR